jgi:hypothetical protein
VAYDETTAGRLRKLLSGQPNVAEQKLMGGLCFMVNGHMSCAVSGRGGLMVRVGPDAHRSMLGEPHAAPMEMRGRIMIGFVRVAPEGYQTDAGLKKWVKRGIDFVATLPKRTTKTPAKAKARAAKRPRRK